MGRNDGNKNRRQGGIIYCSCGKNLGRTNNVRAAGRWKQACAERGHENYKPQNR